MPLKLRGNIWHYEFMLHGQRYWGTTRERNRKRAETFESLRLAEAQQGHLNRTIGKIPTLAEFSAEFLDYIDGRVAGRTLDSDTRADYNHGWGLLSRTRVADMRLNKITRNIASTLSFPGSSHNANSALRTLARMLNYAAELEYLVAAPKIKRPKVHERTALIDANAEQELLQHLHRDAADVFLVVLDSGARPHEAMKIQWSDIYWDRNVLLIIGKGNKKRFVPISDRVRRIFERRLADARSAMKELKLPRDRRKAESLERWVFTGKTAAGHRSTIGKIFRRARTEAKIDPSVVLYSARHTFLTDLQADTGNAFLVQRTAGHESITTTQKYIHPETAGLAAIVNQRNVRRSGLRIVKSA